MNCHLKKSLLGAFLLLSVAALADVQPFKPKEDYCSPKLCHEKKHVACGINASNIEFGDQCGGITEFITFTDSLKAFILYRFNVFRNKIAEGTEGWPPAARMASMYWDDELAYFAQINVRECHQHRDLCRNSAKYNNVGQTVVYRAVSAAKRLEGIRPAMTKMISKWTKWSKSFGDVTINIHNYTFDHYAPKETYAQLILENANKVGCAAVVTLKNDWRQYFLTCNYNHSPMPGKPIYTGKMGMKPGESCKTGHHKTWKHLCGLNEYEKAEESGSKLEVLEAKVARIYGGSNDNGTAIDLNNGNVTALSHDEQRKFYRRKFSRLLNIIRNATRFAKHRDIVIITSNHQVDVDAAYPINPVEELIGIQHDKKDE